MSRTPVIVGLVASALGRWREHRADLRTRRIVAGLPPYLRKDIGWPDGARSRRNPPDERSS